MSRPVPGSKASKPEPFQRQVDARHGELGVRQARGEQQVLGGGQGRLDGVAVSDEAQAGAMAVAIAIDLLTLPVEPAGAPRRQQCQQPQQRGFAGAVGAAQNQRRAVIQRESKLGEHHPAAAVTGERAPLERGHGALDSMENGLWWAAQFVPAEGGESGGWQAWKKKMAAIPGGAGMAA